MADRNILCASKTQKTQKTKKTQIFQKTHLKKSIKKNN